MISVIVIGKNEWERLVACLRSIQTALSALAHEVVYVDSCSTDQSLQTAKALGARCFLLAERKTTAGLGRFVGAKEARGEYLLFLDGDMQLQPGFAEKALMAIAAKGYDGVCGIREDVYLRGGEVVCRNDNYFGCTQERLASLSMVRERSWRLPLTLQETAPPPAVPSYSRASSSSCAFIICCCIFCA